MKKLLLLAASAFLISGTMNAQTLQGIKPIKESAKAHPQATIIDENSPMRAAVISTPIRPKHSLRNPNPRVAAVAKVDIATSTNIYANLVSEGTLGAYNSTVNVLSYTNRKPIGLTPPVSNSGIVYTHVSYDKGATWDTLRYITQNAAPVNRYPNGVIANPPGNTTANQAYAVISAPLINGTTWDGGTFAYSRLDGNASSANYAGVLNIPIANVTDSSLKQWMPRLGMCTGTNGNVYAMGTNYDINNTTNPVFNGNVINRAVWNGTNGYTWDQKNVNNLWTLASDGSQNINSFGSMAFSQDGVTGYVVMLGIDSLRGRKAVGPVIYKTSDAGATWSFYAAPDFSGIFANTFPAPTSGNPTRPWYSSRNGFDVTVDAYGKLHILCEVTQAEFDAAVDTALSLNIFGALFDTYERSNGNWNQILVGTVAGRPAGTATATTDPNTLNWGVTLDARAQITRSADGYKIFYTWLDTDPNLGDPLNEFPNIIGAGADFQNNVTTNPASPINFTAGGTYDANNYWLYASQDGWDNGAGNYVVPVFTATNVNAGGIDTDPWMHQFVSGAVITSADMTTPIVIQSVSEIAVNAESFSIYPNPAKNNAVLNITLDKSADVMVNMINTAGQVAKSINVQSVPAGINSLNLNLDGVKAGLYIVQVNVNGKTMSTRLNVLN